MRKALTRDFDGLVVNVIEIEDGANWTPPVGHYLRDAGNASPGDTWDGTKYVPKPPGPEQVVAEKREAARVRALADIKANAWLSPWGVILKNLVVAQGLVEPEQS